MTEDEIYEAVARERAWNPVRTPRRWLRRHGFWLIGWAKYLTIYRLPSATANQRGWRPCERAWLTGNWPTF